MLITRYNADSLAWEVYDQDTNRTICETHTEETAKQIIKDYNERRIK